MKTEGQRALHALITSLMLMLVLFSCDQAGAGSSSGSGTSSGDVTSTTAQITDLTVSPMYDSVLITWTSENTELLGEMEITYYTQNGQEMTKTIQIANGEVTIPNLTRGSEYSMEINVKDADSNILTTLYRSFCPKDSIDLTVTDTATGTETTIALDFKDPDDNSTIDNIGGVFWFTAGQEVPDPDNIYEIDLDGDGVTDCYLTIDADGSMTLSTEADGNGEEILVTVDDSSADPVSISSVSIGTVTYTDFDRGYLDVTIVDPSYPEVTITTESGLYVFEAGDLITFNATANEGFTISACEWILDGVSVISNTTLPLQVQTTGFTPGSVHTMHVFADMTNGDSVSDTLFFWIQG